MRIMPADEFHAWLHFWDEFCVYCDANGIGDDRDDWEEWWKIWCAGVNFQMNALKL